MFILQHNTPNNRQYVQYAKMVYLGSLIKKLICVQYIVNNCI